MAIQKWPRAISGAVARGEDQTREREHIGRESDPDQPSPGSTSLHPPTSTDFLKFPSSIDPPDPVNQL